MRRSRNWEQEILEADSAAQQEFDRRSEEEEGEIAKIDAGRIRGTVKFWQGHWGFIVPDTGDNDVFVHFSGISGSGFKELQIGNRVEFDTEESDRGPRAVQVVKI